MKKFFSIFAFIAVAAIALTSCSKESDIDPVNENGVKMKTITVRTGIATKTTLDSDHSKLVWSTDDKISLFNNVNTDNSGLTYQSGGDLTVSVPEATTEIYAHYPYFNGNTSGPGNVSVYINKNQTQKNPGELNGYYYPMVAKGTVSSDNKALISFYPVASALALNIYNTELSGTETVTSVKVTPNSENSGFIGRQYMDLAGESLKYNNADASDAITVTLTNPLTLSNTKPANAQTFEGQIYVCLAKQSYKNVKFEITTDKAVYTITSNATPFDCANKDFVPVNINLKNAEKVLTFQEHFKTDQGTFSIEGTTGVWTHASYNGDAYMKGTSYIGGQNTPADAWLISPVLSIQNNNAVLSFSQVVNDYFGNVANEATVSVREINGEWTQLTGFDYPTITSGHFSSWGSADISLSSYNNKKIQIGFNYKGTTAAAGTWEIKDFKVTYAIALPGPEISYAEEDKNISVNIGDPFSAPTLINPHNLTVTYSSSNATVASVNASSGAVTLGNITGTAVITASFDGNDDYLSGSASYTITVIDPTAVPNPETIVFGDLGLENGTQYSDPFDGGNFTITFGGGGNDGKYYDTGSGIRTYGGGTITISSAYKIKQIAFTWDGENAPTGDNADPSGYNKNTAKWTGEANTVVLTRPSGSGHWRLKSVTVYYTTQVNPTYSISIGSMSHGSVTSNANEAEEGTSITLTVTPEETYTLESLTVNGQNVISAVVDNTYTFIMPASNVTVSASFTKSGGGTNQNVTLKYSGTTTTNMTGNNDAAIVGLNATEWSVVGAKGSSNNFPGLNRDGTIRLYYNADGSNAITVSSETGATINSITITYNGTYTNGKVFVGNAEVTGSNGTYTINSDSFVITNGNTSNVQVHIKSIFINYSPAN